MRGGVSAQTLPSSFPCLSRSIASPSSRPRFQGPSRWPSCHSAGRSPLSGNSVPAFSCLAAGSPRSHPWTIWRWAGFPCPINYLYREVRSDGDIFLRGARRVLWASLLSVPAAFRRSILALIEVLRVSGTGRRGTLVGGVTRVISGTAPPRSRAGGGSAEQAAHRN